MHFDPNCRRSIFDLQAGIRHVTARLEAGLDQRITQRFILQPRAEAILATQDVEELGIGAEIHSNEVVVRLRYEIAREFAPYVGVEQSWRLGRSAYLAQVSGEDTGFMDFVAGIRFWF
ncbi:copper resistance protein B [Altererythrobacter sp. KTW20L]|uniref:copper resistance protein B n=1 Tax=Altererythrobacter sp. KTW20L TaxID=2942210 RepID=UPI0032DFC934